MNGQLVSGFVALGFVILLYFKFVRQTTLKKCKPNLQTKGYRLVYTDQKGDVDPKEVIVSEMLVAPTYNLRGKPDYIFINKSKTDMLVIELKSGKIGGRLEPYYGDLMQLAAYFVMVEDIFHIRPKKGRLIYKDYMFVIDNTANLRKDLIKTIAQMREMLETNEGTANASFVTCRHCMCNGTVCSHCKQ